ncbi:MAG: DNA polymerase III subunit beta [Planctomycetota bacterium]
MKITFDRNQMVAAFSIAASVVAARSPKPVLLNVKMDATPDGVLLTATDLEVGVRVDVQGVTVEQPGSVLLPVQRFGNLIRENSDERLQLTSDGNGTTVKGQRATLKFPSGDPEEFPNLSVSREDRCHTVSPRLFHELARRTLFATETESSRYALGGVLLEFGDSKITAVGTDGRRLAKMEGLATMIGDHGKEGSTTIVPSRAFQLMDRGLTDGEGDLQITARNNDIVVRKGGITFFSRLVEGKFPRWRDVLPQRSNAPRVQLTVGPFFTALRQAAIVSSEQSRGIDFTFGDGTLSMSGVTAEVGQSLVELPIDYTGEKITVSLDNRYVSDVLKVLDADRTITVEIQSGAAAVLFLTEDGYAYVVMPLAKDN